MTIVGTRAVRRVSTFDCKVVASRRLALVLQGHVEDRQWCCGSTAAAASPDRPRRGRGPIDWPLRTLLCARDQLRAALSLHPLGVLPNWSDSPPPTGSTQWDTLFAAVVAPEFEDAGLAPPAWTSQEPLRPEWVPPHPSWSEQQVRDQTPDWLRAAGIFMPARSLFTVKP